MDISAPLKTLARAAPVPLIFAAVFWLHTEADARHQESINQLANQLRMNTFTQALSACDTEGCVDRMVAMLTSVIELQREECYGR